VKARTTIAVDRGTSSNDTDPPRDFLNATRRWRPPCFSSPQTRSCWSVFNYFYIGPTLCMPINNANQNHVDPHAPSTELRRPFPRCTANVDKRILPRRSRSCSTQHVLASHHLTRRPKIGFHTQKNSSPRSPAIGRQSDASMNSESDAPITQTPGVTVHSPRRDPPLDALMQPPDNDSRKKNASCRKEERSPSPPQIKDEELKPQPSKS